MPDAPDGFDAAFAAARIQLGAAATAPAPFRALGHDRGRFFFTTGEGQQVLTFSARDVHSAGDLAKLAPLRWWEGAYPGKESFSVKAAGDALIRACYLAGVFDPDAVRGRGVWIDAGRTVLHLGDRLIVDGADTPIQGMRSNFIYEQARTLQLDLAETMSDEDGRRLLRTCCEVAWENPDRDGRLLAGWIVCAMICGSLAWRPHLWLVSEAGGGKSWVLDNLVRPLLRALALQVQSKTSEAGIRGELGCDARPVVFDEAETQNEIDRSRMQQVLDLARQASSEDGGAIIKGTKDGGSRHFRIRSMFCLASVNLGLSQAADESRFLVLPIGAGTPEQFTALKASHAEVFTPGLAARLLARTLRLLPTIRHNAEMLADAIARTGAGRRAGDTLGAVLAGGMSLGDERRLTPPEADRMIAAREWVKQAAAQVRPEPEWRRALDHLCQRMTRHTNSSGRAEDLTLSELLLAASSRSQTTSTLDAAATLGRSGLRYELKLTHEKQDHAEMVLIANRSDGIQKAFDGTPWASAWTSTMARSPGALRTDKTWKFAGRASRALAIPLRTILGEVEIDAKEYG